LKPVFKRLISKEISKCIIKGRQGRVNLRKFIEQHSKLEEQAHEHIEREQVYERGI
jgi:hypothetical protein